MVLSDPICSSPTKVAGGWSKVPCILEIRSQSNLWSSVISSFDWKIKGWHFILSTGYRCLGYVGEKKKIIENRATSKFLYYRILNSVLVQPVISKTSLFKIRSTLVLADSASALDGHSIAPGALLIFIQQQPAYSPLSAERAVIALTGRAHLLWRAVTAEHIFYQHCIALFMLFFKCNLHAQLHINGPVTSR